MRIAIGSDHAGFRYKERLKQALAANRRYVPRVLGLFAFQDLFNDRDEQDLVDRGFVQPQIAPGQTGPAPLLPSRLVLWGDHDPAEPGYDPPTFAEMTEVAITILDRAARQQRHPGLEQGRQLPAEPRRVGLCPPFRQTECQPAGRPQTGDLDALADKPCTHIGRAAPGRLPADRRAVGVGAVPGVEECGLGHARSFFCPCDKPGNSLPRPCKGVRPRCSLE